MTAAPRSPDRRLRGADAEGERATAGVHPDGTAARTVRYATLVTEVGPQVEEFVAAGIVVFFRDDAPEELRSFSVLHRPTVTEGGVAPGDELDIDGRRLRITAVGDVADTNLVQLGHISLKANGATEAPLPGDLCVERGPLPQVPVGARVAVVAGHRPTPFRDATSEPAAGRCTAAGREAASRHLDREHPEDA